MGPTRVMPRQYTLYQYRELERSFARSVYLQEEELQELSQELGLTREQLFNWFKNRRRNRRRGGRVYHTSKSVGLQRGTVVRAEQFEPVVLELVSSSDVDNKSAGTPNLSECVFEEDCDLIDWDEVRDILELVDTPK